MKDRFGNDLQQGDMVLIRIDQPFIIGTVLQTKKGGLTIVGGPNDKPGETPDTIHIAAEFMASPPFNQLIHKLYGIPKEPRKPN